MGKDCWRCRLAGLRDQKVAACFDAQPDELGPPVALELMELRQREPSEVRK
jgi:hypothetical protein